MNILPTHLLVRSGYRCAYCRGRIADALWDREHVMARARGGEDSVRNLVAACPRCNRNKGSAVRAVDPVSGLTVPLFNPHGQRWEDHFTHSGANVVGRTPTGRATATLLFRTTEQYVPADLKWDPLEELQDETAYFYLNHLRALRLSNRFRELEAELVDPSLPPTLTAKDQELATLAFQLLRAETLFTRSRESDVRAGMALVDRLLGGAPLQPRVTSELYEMRSILCQQLATCLALESDVRTALQIQMEVARWHFTSIAILGESALRGRLRFQTMVSKYRTADEASLDTTALGIARDEAHAGDLRSLTYSADVVTSLSPNQRLFTAVAELAEEVMAVCGYGQDFDLARGIVLRRRWWTLRAMSEVRPDLDLLARDISFWRRSGMHNEIRELALSLIGVLNRVKDLRRRKLIREMAEITGRRLLRVAEPDKRTRFGHAQ